MEYIANLCIHNLVKIIDLNHIYMKNFKTNINIAIDVCNTLCERIFKA